MRVLVDTSVWVDYLNGHPSTEADGLARLIAGSDDVCTCGVVVAEVFQGLRRDRSRARLERLFRELTYFEPTGIEPYVRAAQVYRELRSRGVTVRSTIDCLIAVVAEESGAYLLARDRDLEAIVRGGVLRTAMWEVSSGR